jgi:hypothetical protein
MTIDEYQSYAVQYAGKKNKICFHCNGDIAILEDMVGLCANYHIREDGMCITNLYFHHGCFKSIAGDRYYVTINGVRDESGLLY